MAARPASTICIASINTAWATELCLRSLEVRDAGRPYRVIIGDSGSTDGTLPMLVRMLQRGVVDDIELAAGGRRHAAWIDHWVATCPTEYLVLLDSDVEIRQDGWLADMHRERAEHEAVLVTAELEPPRPEWTKPGVQIEARPAAYCMLLDVAKVRALGRSFEEWYDGSVGYDVGAWVFAGIVDAGMSYAVMPQSWLPAVRHWGAMSYARNVRQLRAQHRADDCNRQERDCWPTAWPGAPEPRCSQTFVTFALPFVEALIARAKGAPLRMPRQPLKAPWP